VTTIYHSIDMPTALHPQTQLTFWFDGEVLPRNMVFPMKLRIPTKLGSKSEAHRRDRNRHDFTALLGNLRLQLVQWALTQTGPPMLDMIIQDESFHGL